MDNSVGEFLRARRARLAPSDLGLPDGVSRRRVPGLRREELAQAVGVSVDYYVRLEQGRRANVSDQVLEAVARVLRLDGDEREHLFQLARRQRGGPGLPRPVAPRPLDAGITDLMDRFHDVPTLLLGRRTDVLAWNAAADAVFGMSERPASRRNAARDLFGRAGAAQDYPEWDDLAADVVAQLHYDAGRHPDDPLLAALVGQLSIASQPFRQLWARHDVRQKTHGTVRLVHPVVGELVLTYQALARPAEPDHLLLTYLAERGSPTDERLRVLMSWNAGPGARRPPAPVAPGDAGA